MTKANPSDQKDKKKLRTNSKKKHQVTNAIIHVYASFNNTIISISEMNGNTMCWTSAGSQGFRGSRKATPYAAQVAVQKAIAMAVDRGLISVHVKVKGPGVGREAALRAIHMTGIIVHSISDITYLPHNGCRPSKRRRV